jgi:hypothetical protein
MSIQTLDYRSPSARRITHRHLIGDTGRIDLNAVMLFAWQGVRREQALWAKVGASNPPSLREMLSTELANAWGWARTMQRDRRRHAHYIDRFRQVA